MEDINKDIKSYILENMKNLYLRNIGVSEYAKPGNIYTGNQPNAPCNCKKSPLFHMKKGRFFMNSVSVL